MNASNDPNSKHPEPDKTSPPSLQSSKEESKTSEEHQGDAQKKQDGMHLFTVGCFVVCTFFWLLALVKYHPQPWLVVQNAFISLTVCFTLDTFVACVAPGLSSRLVTMHFSLGALQNILYIILLNIGTDLFAKVWTSIYFGYYQWTWIMLLTHCREFFPMFRVFYTIHHAISFFITGSWIIIGLCCFANDNDFIYRAIVIWLSSDLWVYSLNIYRSLRPETDKDFIRKWQTIVFGIERVHRSVAYLQPLTVPASRYNLLMWVVLSTGLFNDIVDAAFQLHSLCKHYQHKKLRVLAIDAKIPMHSTIATTNLDKAD